MEKDRIDKEAALMAMKIADSLNLTVGTNIVFLRLLCRRMLVAEQRIIELEDRIDTLTSEAQLDTLR